MLRRRQGRAAAVHPVLGVAPEPRLARLETPDHRVPGRGRVGARVLGRGGVAAADVPALGAPAQVEPPATVLLALGAACPAGRDRSVDRFRGHLHTPFLVPPLPDAACLFWYSQRNSYPQTVAAGRTVTRGAAGALTGFPDGRHHRRLDGVQPVLRLVEHDRGG